MNILISGGTSGVGKAVAKSFAVEDNNITLLGRNEERAKQAVNDLKDLTGNQNIDYLLGDLAVESENKKVAEEYAQNHDVLDILVNSAGVMPRTAQDNITKNIQSHYWLTHNLVSLLKKSDNPNVFLITGASQIVKYGPINEWQFNALFKGIWLLTHKTLLVTLMANELAADDIKVNAVFPGEVKSELMKWTQKATNEDVVAIKNIMDSKTSVTGQFFNNYGQLISLNERKYSLKNARKALKRYL